MSDESKTAELSSGAVIAAETCAICSDGRAHKAGHPHIIAQREAIARFEAEQQKARSPVKRADRAQLSRDDVEARLLLEIKFVAYALLGFDKKLKLRCRSHVVDCIEGVIEMTREMDSRRENSAPVSVSPGTPQEQEVQHE